MTLIALCVFGTYDQVKDLDCSTTDATCDWEDPWSHSTNVAYTVLSRLGFVIGLMLYCICWIWGPVKSFTREFLTFSNHADNVKIDVWSLHMASVLFNIILWVSACTSILFSP
eukprot:UN03685